MNLPNRRGDIIFDATEPRDFAVEEYIARAPIIIAGLADRADIADRFPMVKVVARIAFVWAQILPKAGRYLNKDSGHVSVPAKAATGNERTDPHHLLQIPNIFREDIFVERITGTAVDQKAEVGVQNSRPFREKVPQPRILRFT